MQQSPRPFDGTDPTYTIEDFLNAITANMAMTAEPNKLIHRIVKHGFLNDSL